MSQSLRISVPRRSRQAAGVALLTCASFVLPGAAPELARAAAPEASEEPASADAETIFRRGQAKYETADYNGAIELWTEAYALVDSRPENAGIKALLIYNLAQAHVKAYELDEQAIHLKQAQQLLQSFRANLELLYEDPAQLEEESAKVDERLAEIEAMIAELEAAAVPEEEPEEPAVEPPPPTVDEPVDAGEPPPSGKPLIIAGGAVLGLGVAAGAVGIVGAVMGANANDISDLEPTDLDGREERFASGRTGNTLLIVGGVSAGVLLATGAALIGVGVKRNKARSGRSAARPSLPRVGVSWGGVTLSGEF